MNSVLSKAVNNNFRPTPRLVAYFLLEVGERLSGSDEIGTFQPSRNWWCPGPSTKVMSLELRTGSAPGLAEIEVSQPPGTKFAAAGNVAFRADSELRNIMRGTRVLIKAVFDQQDGTKFAVPIWTGSVAKSCHERDRREGLIFVCLDGRDDIQNVRIVGRYQINPGSGTTLPSSEAAYLQGFHAHFNPGGIGNLMFTSDGIPVFAPRPGFGLDNDEKPPDFYSQETDWKTAAQTKATYWTMGTILDYLRHWHSPGAFASSHFTWRFLTPPELDWPETFAANIDAEGKSNFDQGVGQNFTALGGPRKGRDMNLKGMLLLEAIEYVLYTAGGWSIGFDNFFNESGSEVAISSSMKAVPTRFQGGGITLLFAFGGDVREAMPGPVVTRASYEEDGESLITVCVGDAGLIFNEIRADNYASGINNLEEAWKSTVEDDALAELAQSLNLDEEGFQRVVQRYPGFLETWKLKPTYDPMAGTEYAGFPRANYSRRIMPHLLSFLGVTSGPKDFLINSFPIRVEVRTPAGWVVATELSGLNVKEDGIIELPILKLAPLGFNSDGTQAPGSWRWTSGPFDTGDGKLSITKQPIRLSCAVNFDHGLTTAISMPGSVAGAHDFGGVFTDSPDHDRIAKGFQRVHYVDLGNLYQLWLRKGSYPVPESLIGAASGFPDKTSRNNALKNDEDMLRSHVRRVLYEMGRLQKRGRLIFDGNIVTGLKPGTQIAALRPLGVTGVPDFPIRAVVDKVFVKQDTNGYWTEAWLR